MKRRRDMHRGVFGACKFGLRIGRFSLGPPFEEFQKMADFGVRLFISMRLKCNHWTTFCRKPPLQEWPQVRAMANLAKTPKSAIF